MTNPQGCEVPWNERDEYIKYGPYGSEGHLVGELALSLSHIMYARTQDSRPQELPVRPDGSPDWDTQDRKALQYYEDLHSSIAFIDTAPDDPEVPGGVPGDKLADLFRKVHRLHTAMPFSEGERYWLFSGGGKTVREQCPDEVTGLLVCHTTIISAGVEQPLHGPDLVRRWSAWRRRTDEFASQTSQNKAYWTLRSIAEQILPEQELREQDRQAEHRHN